MMTFLGRPAFHYKFLIREQLSNGLKLSQSCHKGRGEGGKGKSGSRGTEVHGRRKNYIGLTRGQIDVGSVKL